ncbi:MAG: hypothetical protein PHH77_01135 [Victivallaceae bacterium]|nr:hypothetical protein [Victivallaceae bacterium]
MIKRLIGKKKLFIFSASFLFLLMVAVIYGALLQKYKIFPYNSVKALYEVLGNEEAGPWSIGIYEGTSPFDLVSPPDIANPVLTGQTCSDALFVADPFIAVRDEKFYLFFERVNKADNKGDIAYAESPDARHWEYKGIVISEKFHLSYPYVFAWKGDYYLIAESHHDLSVRLYQAEKFPDRWKYVKNLLSGYSFVDPSIFRYNNKWWMFVSTPASNIMNLYYSDDLLGRWKPHPMNPIIKFDEHTSRCGGRVIIYHGKPLRFAQDDAPYYGIRIWAFEITELSETKYAEKPASKKPIVTRSGKGWNAAGMHHVDLHQLKGKWIAAVDGKSQQED